MSNFRVFGMLSTFAAVVAFLADILVAPAMLAIVEGSRRRSKPVTAEESAGAVG